MSRGRTELSESRSVPQAITAGSAIMEQPHSACGMAAVLPAPRSPRGRGGGGLLLSSPSPVGFTFPAVSWDGTHCRAGLYVTSSELLMSYSSCGVNNLSASVSHLGSLGDPSQWYSHPESGHWGEAVGVLETSRGSCAAMLPPTPFLR